MAIPTRTLPDWAVGDFPAGPNAWNGLPRREATGLTAFANTGLEPQEPTGAQHFNDWLGLLREWVEYYRAELGLGIFGDGSDGDVTISANETLTRTMYYNSLTVDSGAVVTTAGYPIFVRGVLTVDGAGSLIGWTGNDGVAAVGAAAGAAGAALADSVLAGGVAGGDGGAAGAPGAAGANSSNAVVSSAGGAGGDGTPGSGGAGGTSTLSVADIRSLAVALRGQTVTVASTDAITGGAGGGGASGGALVGGPGGGGGGGVVLIAAESIVLTNGGALSVDGGAGANGVDDAGGGGGGVGGALYLVYRVTDEAGGTVSAAGGTGGTAGGTPPSTDGSAGASGLVIRVTDA